MTRIFFEKENNTQLKCCTQNAFSFLLRFFSHHFEFECEQMIEQIWTGSEKKRVIIVMVNEIRKWVTYFFLKLYDLECFFYKLGR